MTDPVLESLKELLAEARPEPGRSTKLPTERVLAEKLGVNRSILREKMAVLKALGFVEQAQGSGTFLTVPGSDFLRFYFDLALNLGFISLVQIEEARRMIEGRVVKLAAMNATEEDIKALAYFLDQLLAAHDAERGHELDHAFHMHLGVASHNPVIVMIQEALSGVMRRVLTHRRKIVSAIPRGLETTNKTHIAIVEAVRAHNPQAAEAAMEAHFEVWNEWAGKMKKKDD